MRMFSKIAIAAVAFAALAAGGPATAQTDHL